MWLQPCVEDNGTPFQKYYTLSVVITPVMNYRHTGMQLTTLLRKGILTGNYTFTGVVPYVRYYALTVICP